MKSLIKIAALIAVLTLIFSFKPKSNQHIGIWKGVDNGETGYFTFDTAGFATLEIEGQVMGGRSFHQNGVTAQMKYTVDYSKKPIWIDLIVTNVETHQETLRARGIIEFLSADQMKISLNLQTGLRPYEFVDSETILLSRQK